VRKLYSPRDEAEVVLIKSLLDAAGITYFVHNDHFGSLRPGACIPLYNEKTVMVSESDLPEARRVIADIMDQPDVFGTPIDGYSLRDKLRMIFEVLFFGWLMPGSRRRKCQPPEDAANSAAPD